MPKKVKEISPNQELLRKLLTVLRDYAQVLAEKQGLIAILNTAVLLDQPPIGWEEGLTALRETPAYKKIAEQFDPLLDDAQQVVDLREVEQLLSTMPSARIPH